MFLISWIGIAGTGIVHYSFHDEQKLIYHVQPTIKNLFADAWRMFVVWIGINETVVVNTILNVVYLFKKVFMVLAMLVLVFGRTVVYSVKHGMLVVLEP